MAAFLLRRIGLMFLTLFLLSLIVFFAGQILPGDPGRFVLGPFAANSAVQALDHHLGVDRPLLTQYLGWIGGLLHGNLGTSYTYQTAVEPFIRAALINSVKLAARAFVIVVPLGRIEQVRLAFAHPRGQAVYRLAAGENVLDDRSGPAHGGERLRRQRDGFTMPRGRNDLRNSQVTSIKHDRH